MSTREVLTVEEAARFLRVSVADVNDAILKGLLGAAALGPTYRISRHALDCFLRGELPTRPSAGTGSAVPKVPSPKKADAPLVSYPVGRRRFSRDPNDRSRWIAYDHDGSVLAVYTKGHEARRALEKLRDRDVETEAPPPRHGRVNAERVYRVHGRTLRRDPESPTMWLTQDRNGSLIRRFRSGKDGRKFLEDLAQTDKLPEEE